MTIGGSSQQGVTGNPEIQNIKHIEKQSNLSPLAQRMLDGVFRNSNFEEFQKSILHRTNLLVKGVGNEIDKKLLLKEIDSQISNLDEYGENKTLASNYFSKLRTMIEEIDIKEA